MTPPNDVTDVSLLFEYIRKHANKLLNHEQRIKIMEDRCESHQPTIDEITENKIRANERSKTMKTLWGYISSLAIGFGLLIALLANLSKIIEVVSKMF